MTVSEIDRKRFLLSASAAAGVIGLATHTSQGASAAQMPSMMPLPPPDQRADPDMKRVLEAFLAFNAPPITAVTPEVARELPSINVDAVAAVISAEGKRCVQPVGMEQNTVIAGPGGQLLLRIYTPAGSGPFPVIVYFHGGGFVIANLDTYDASARGLTNGSNAIVVSVAYREAPEHRFPAAVEDAFAAYRYVVANAASFGGDPKRVAVAGESAGGNLAAVVPILARNSGIQMPVHQLLVYPEVDFSFDTGSVEANVTTIPLNRAALFYFRRYYLNSASEIADPRVSPLRADLHRLPSATIINAEIDPLRDDGARYAAKLQASGVPVTRTVYSGVTHEFFGMQAVVDKARAAMAQANAALRAAFAG